MTSWVEAWHNGEQQRIAMERLQRIQNGEKVLGPLTETDVRRIVREELRAFWYRKDAK